MTETKDFIELIDRMKEIALAKNADYAGEEDFLKNFKIASMLGVKPSMGVAIRLTDKWSRVCQLLQKENPAVVEESLEDTLIDMANYALLMVLCLREEKQNKTEKKDW